MAKIKILNRLSSLIAHYAQIHWRSISSTCSNYTIISETAVCDESSSSNALTAVLGWSLWWISAGRRSNSSRRLFLQAAEVIFKGTADLFHPRHFISLYRPTSGLLTVEGKSSKRGNERGGGENKERDDKKRAIRLFSRKSAANSSARILFLHVESRRTSSPRRGLSLASDDFLSSSSSRRAEDDATLMTVA